MGFSIHRITVLTMENEMSIEKKGVLSEENEAPKTEPTKTAQENTQCEKKPSCGTDTMSQASEAAATPPKS